MTSSNSSRKPRYRRASDVRIRLQERDRKIIYQVYKHRFLDSNHIEALIGGSRQALLRRLQGLFHAGYLTRPLEQLRPYQKGSRPIVYGIGNEGVEVLETEYKIPKGKIDWTRKNREVKGDFLEHALMVAHFMVCLETACRKRKDVELIGTEEIFKNLPNKNKGIINPFSLKVSVRRTLNKKQQTFKIGVIPDKVFGLYFPNDPPGKNKAYFFLEADRATMPVRRSNFYRTSIFKKMVGYWGAYQQDLFKKNFGFKAGRVLIVTKSQDRINNMIAVNKEVDDRKKGSKMFLFTTQGQIDLSQPGELLKSIWRNGRDDSLSSLLD